MGDGTKSPRGKGLTIQVHHGDTKTHLHTEFENYTLNYSYTSQELVT